MPTHDRQGAAETSSVAQRLRTPQRLEFPAPHLGLSWALLGAADLAEVVNLDALCRSLDRPSSAYSRREWEVALGSAPTSWTIEVIGGRDSTGALQAVGVVSVPQPAPAELRAEITAFIAPDWRSRGIGRALIDYQDARARQILTEDGRDLPVAITSRVDSHMADRRRLLAATGFSPVRSMEELQAHTAQAAQSNLGLDERVSIVPWRDGLSEMLRSLHNRGHLEFGAGNAASAIDWNRQAWEVERNWSFVALADGVAVGSILASREQAVANGQSTLEGRIRTFDLERAWRRLDIASALLSAAASAMVNDGVSEIAIEIEPSRTGQLKDFLSRHGFVPRASRIVYAIEV